MGGSVKAASDERIPELACFCMVLVNVHLLGLGISRAAISMHTSTPAVFRFRKLAFLQRTSGAAFQLWSCRELMILKDMMPVLLMATIMFHDMTVQKAQHGASIARTARIVRDSHLTSLWLIWAGQVLPNCARSALGPHLRSPRLEVGWGFRLDICGCR